MKISRMSYTCVCLAICILISAGIGTLAYAGKWVPIGGPATGVFVGGNGLYARLQSGDIYRYEGSPNNWTKVGGPGTTWAVNDTNIYGLSRDANSVWQYTGTGTNWTPIGGPAKLLIAGGRALYATNPNTGDIYRYEGSPNNWTKVGGPGATFAINKAGLYGLSLDQKSVWQYTGTGNKWSMIASAPPGQDRIGYIWARGKDLYMATPTPGESFTYAAIWQYQP